MFSGDAYGAEEDLAYRDFGDERDRDIFHTTTLDIASLTAGLTFNLTGRGAAVVPYLGVGGGVYFWNLEESGDFIDFGDPDDLVIFTGTFDESGEALGWYWLAGVEVPLGAQWAFFAEGRWHQVEDELAGDFAGFGDLDLSGRQINGGFSWRF
jgi:opacity protein-like surface antigen